MRVAYLAVHSYLFLGYCDRGAYVFLGLHGLRKCRRNSHSQNNMLQNLHVSLLDVIVVR